MKIKTTDAKYLSEIVAIIAAFLLISCYVHLLFSLPLGIEAFLNIIIISPVYFISLLISRRAQISLSITAGSLIFIYYLNEYVFYSRNVSITYFDAFCIGDALNVAKNYPMPFNFEIAWKISTIIATTVLFFYVIYRYEVKFNISCVLTRKGFIVSAVLLLFMPLIMIRCYVLQPEEFSADYSFDTNSFTAEKGVVLAFLCEGLNSVPSTPENYTYEKAEECLNSYSNTPANTDEVNVIVIMNEAFSDFSELYDTDYAFDNLPFIHSLEKNTFKGKLLVTSYGGNTCNTEFEFLTGCSLSFLPNGALPYQMYIKNKTDSLCFDFTDDYHSTGIHPYIGQEWRRKQVYPCLGFDTSIFGENFSDFQGYNDIENITNQNLSGVDFGKDLEYLRGFITDNEAYRKVIEVYDKDKEEDKNSFIFCVTVQNHGGYLYKGSDFISDKYTGKEAYDQYLTLISYTDKAFQNLIEHFSKEERKTVIVMFGDHQPGGIDVFNDVTFTDPMCSTFPEGATQIVPYIMWANYDIEWACDEYISPNYLSAVLKQNIGLQLTEWDNLRLKAKESYPVLTQMFAVNKDYQFTSLNDTNDELLDYKYVQYMKLFG